MWLVFAFLYPIAVFLEQLQMSEARCGASTLRVGLM